jgi:starvation-inducible DNA-binding protein
MSTKRQVGQADKGGATPQLEAQPILNQRSPEIQPYGTLVSYPLVLNEDVRRQSVEILNQILVDTLSLNALYKKHHWQVAGATFFQLHCLFEKHFTAQTELIDKLGERIQTLGGIAIVMAPDVAEMTKVQRPPRGREQVPVQLSRLLEAHELILAEAHAGVRITAASGDDGTNDLLMGDVIRTHEMQAWFLSEHLVDTPEVRAR